MHNPTLYLQGQRHGLRPDMMRIITLAMTPREPPSKVVDLLPHWLDRVLQGEMTVHEADAAYGPERATGRPRKHATFAHYLGDRISYAESGEADAEILRLLRRVRPGQAGSADTMRVNRLLETTGREAASRLRDLLAELQTADT
jgi:hypothetical protein